MAISDTDIVLAREKAAQSPARWLLISGSALLGSLVEGACAILVASASAKGVVALGAVAGAIKASRLHSDIIRVPVMLAAAAAAALMLVVVWNAWRSRNRSEARWRLRPLTFREKFRFTVTLIASILTLALVVAEAMEHPIFHIPQWTSSPQPLKVHNQTALLPACCGSLADVRSSGD